MSVRDRIKAGDYDTKLPFLIKAQEQDITTEEFLASREAWHSDRTRLEGVFKADLFAEHGVTDNPKAERCWELAWEYGHPSGLMEVANYFDDLVDLIKEPVTDHVARAKQLRKELEEYGVRNITSVGVQEKARRYVVYVKDTSSANVLVPARFRDFDVVVKVSGPIRPAHDGAGKKGGRNPRPRT